MNQSPATCPDPEIGEYATPVGASSGELAGVFRFVIAVRAEAIAWYWLTDRPLDRLAEFFQNFPTRLKEGCFPSVP